MRIEYRSSGNCSRTRHVVEPRTLLVALEVIGSNAVITKTAHLVGDFETFRRDHSTFAGGHGFYRMETENIEIRQSAHRALL